MTARRPIRWLVAAATFALVVGLSWLVTWAQDNEKQEAITQSIPDMVMLDQLSKTEGLYEPVPFNHKAHSGMSGMKGGCTTCHHRQPEVATRPADSAPHGALASKNQADASKHPACRTCHEPKRMDLRQPGLKGAYHRQCLNCHREWAHANNCNVCHKPKGLGSADAKAPTETEIMTRMHPPVPEPEERLIKTHFTPADGPNILFRHKEHINRFDVKCVTCHQAEESCSRCHKNGETTKEPAPVKHVTLDRTWAEVHQKCSTCHVRQENRCTSCHFKEGQTAPAAFEHATTGQLLDKDHASLKCGECHASWAKPKEVGCGTSSCHTKSDRPYTFPQKKPGPVLVVKNDADDPTVKAVHVPLKQDSVEFATPKSPSPRQ